MMYIFQGIISGLIATIIFDLFNFSLNFAYNIDITNHLIAEILNTRTKKQDKKIRAQLKRYRNDIETLINHE